MHKMELNCLFKMHHPSNHKMPKNKNSPPSEKPSNDPWAPFHPPVMQKCIFKQKKSFTGKSCKNLSTKFAQKCSGRYPQNKMSPK